MFPSRLDRGREPTMDIGPSGERHINIRGNPVQNPICACCHHRGFVTGKNTHIHSHRGKNKRQDLRKKKMGGPNDQDMSSTWFHFELKILEHLTQLGSRNWALVCVCVDML